MSLVLFYTVYISGGWILQTCSGMLSRPSYHQIAFERIDAAVPGVIGEPYSMASSGSCAPAHGGKTYPRNMARTRLCIDDSRTGYVPKCSKRCCWPWPKTSRIEAELICGSALSTEPLFRRKKGALRGQN
jgi:hypothetical protein